MRPNAYTLNAGQKSRLNVVVCGLASTCLQVEQLLHTQQGDLILSYTNDLTVEERRIITSTLAGVMQQLAELAQQANLAPRVVDVRRHIVAMLSIEWADLIDTRPAELRRYGAVDPGTAESLEPIIDGLTQRVNALISLLQSTQVPT